jgi:hypothetical protein
MSEIKITKIGKPDYMGFAWFRIWKGTVLISKIKATDSSHALAIYNQLNN